MGQRHQLFVIAKPEGQQYRSLAAVHHQWLYGMSALVTCHRLLRIFQDDANRLPIQQELAFASELFGEASEADIKALVARNDEGAAPSHVPCPFPFITTCLVVGASYDPELGKCSSVDEECFGMGYNHGDNNNGITVLDISDLGNVRYCFVDYQGMESARAVPLYTPLDGWTYLMAYFNDADDIVVNNQSTTKALEKYALVDSSALADCWPKGRWQPAMGGGRPEHGLNRKSNKMSVRSLFSLSKEKLFQELLSRESPPDLALLDQPMLIRGFAHDLQRYLIDNAEALSKSPAAIELLRKAFANETTFDFTPFQGKISAPGLVALVSNEAMGNIKTVNFSGFGSNTDLRTVASVLRHLKLDSLYLLERPDRSTDHLAETLEALAKCSDQPLVRQKLVLGSAFSRSIRQNFLCHRIPTVDSNYWKTFPIIQLLYRGPSQCNLLHPNEPWLTDFFLGDAFLTPDRFVTGLLNIIKGRFQDPKRAGPLKGELDVPLAFASAASSLKTFARGTEVSPIPAEAYARCKQNYHSSPSEELVIPIRHLDPVGWNAVMVHTVTMDRPALAPMNEMTRFKVALVRSKRRPIPISNFRDRTCELEVVDLRGFVEMTAPEHVDELVSVLSELTTWAQTDNKLVSKLSVSETISTLKAFAEKSDSRPKYW